MTRQQYFWSWHQTKGSDSGGLMSRRDTLWHCGFLDYVVGENCSRHLKGAVCSSETSVPIYQTTWCYNKTQNPSSLWKLCSGILMFVISHFNIIVWILVTGYGKLESDHMVGKSPPTLLLLHRSLLAQLSSTFNWDWMLFCFMEWDCPSIMQCILCFQKVFVFYSK